MIMTAAYLTYLSLMLIALAASFRWHAKRYLGTSLIVLTLVMAMFAPVMGSIL